MFIIGKKKPGIMKIRTINGKIKSEKKNNNIINLLFIFVAAHSKKC
jgi:hypothetical protein